jgi:hypothetical protein
VHILLPNDDSISNDINNFNVQAPNMSCFVFAAAMRMRSVVVVAAATGVLQTAREFRLCTGK